MRFIFLLVIILFLSSANISAADTNKLNFNNKEINELIKNNEIINFIYSTDISSTCFLYLSSACVVSGVSSISCVFPDSTSVNMQCIFPDSS